MDKLKFLMPSLTAVLETLLNRLLFRDRSTRAVRLRLVGKVLRIRLQELNTPLLFAFSERQVDVLGEWNGSIDCTVNARFAVLLQLHDHQQLSLAMRSGELVVEGDIQLVQQLVTLLALAEWDPAEWLAPYLGDIAAQSVAQGLHKSGCSLISSLQRQQRYLAETLTEECQVAPSPLLITWFNEEVDNITRAVDTLSTRIAMIEAKDDTK